MLPPDLSIYSTQWLEREIARRHAQLESPQEGQDDPSADLEDLEDDLQMLQATLESKNMYLPWQTAQLHPPEDLSSGEGASFTPYSSHSGGLGADSDLGQTALRSSQADRSLGSLNYPPALRSPADTTDLSRDRHELGDFQSASSISGTAYGPRPVSNFSSAGQSIQRKRAPSLSYPAATQRAKLSRSTPQPLEGATSAEDAHGAFSQVNIPDDVLAELCSAMSREELQEAIRQAEQQAQDEALARNMQSSVNQPPAWASANPASQSRGDSLNRTYQTFLGPSASILRNNSITSPSQLDHTVDTVNASSSQNSAPIEHYRDIGGQPVQSSGSTLPSLHVSNPPNQGRRSFSHSNYRYQDIDVSPDDSSSDEITEIRRSEFVPSNRSRQADYRSSAPWPGTSNWQVGPAAASPLQTPAHGSISYRSRPVPYQSVASTYHGAGGGHVYQPGASGQGMVNEFRKMFAQPVENLIGDATRLLFGSHEPGPAYQGSDDGTGFSHNPDYYGEWEPRMDSRETAEEIKNLVNNIRPDEELDSDENGGNPDDLASDCPLYVHQRLGVAWMRKMEEGTNKGGILADDMGLGKTVQAIALMLTRRSEDPSNKTTLIVAPVALLKQWESEIAAKVKPSRRLSTFIYHGNTKSVTWASLKRYDVVLTTYGMLASEYSRKEKGIAGMSGQNVQPGPKLVLLDSNTVFHRVILDEAHSIRNTNTKNFKAVMQLQSQTRFCMTGTPMMNSVKELYALIAFLRIRPFSDAKHFREHISGPMKGYNKNLQTNAIRKLHTLLKAILLRRTKKSEINGKPILTLPERTTNVVHAVLEGDQLAFYQALETRSQLRFNRYLKQGTVGAFYGAVLLLLLRLRQACCHPHLIRNFEQEASYLKKTPEDLEHIARELIPADVVRRIIEEGIIDCPICMDGMENPLVFVPCGHRTCSECFTRLSESTDYARDEDSPSTTFRCMSCRATIDSRKVTDWSAFSKVYNVNTADENLMADEPDATGIENASKNGLSDSESVGSSNSEDETDSGDDDDSLDDFIVPDDDILEKREDDGEGAAGHAVSSNGKKIKIESTEIEAASDKSDDPQIRKKSKSRAKRASRKRKGKAKISTKGKKESSASNKQKHKSLAELQRESRRNQRARHRYFEKLKENWVSSAKIDKCLEILESIITQTHDEKAIVFSQFTSFLDLLEVALMERPWRYQRYDGSMSATARNDAVLEFTNRKSCRLMLVSLKAGNAGLNLTAANHVIILDPFWNPYIEEQAVDRAHRIGQRRPVTVHRILIRNTVEDRIMDIQNRKREVIDSALDENASRSISRLGAKDLAYLFGVN